ncbi:MAG: LysM peptidoglycan-binding domain-containing protein [Candidatus Aminicenantes bacterium]|nr:LysM peptidoglycan-binding domain-containing protein [Candidatus Aminicenantes bacterium]
MSYRYSLLSLFLSALIIILNLSCTSPKKNSPVKQTPPQTTTEAAEKTDALSHQDKASHQDSTRSFATASETSQEQEIKAAESEPQENGAPAEEVYSLYQEAQAALEKGELDQALAFLDQAYAALLKIEASPESPLYQEKHDLRILLAQKIQQVYAFRLPPPSTNHKTIPLVENSWVQAEIKSFQTVERKFFEEAYQRSGLYRPMIVEELKKAGLPEELSWLPLIESGFRPRALSRARALGLWQFIASTGYRYGLKRDKFIDERMDPVKSTRAAIKYLTELHDFFGDWTTAIASYNCGELRVQNVIRAQKIDYLDNFWDLFANLPYETARYVPRFIATLLIIENPEKYGFNLPQPEQALTFETVKLNKPVKLSLLASRLGLSPDSLSLLNPELRHDSTPNYEYELRVPVGYGEKTLACLTELPTWIPPDAVYGWHTVKKGETLGLIARRYRTSVKAIVRLNNLKSSTLIYPGQKLKIPGRVQGLAVGDNDGNQTQANSTSSFGSGKIINYVVKPGDTLFQISRTYGVSVEKIRKDNGLESDTLSVGQKLTIKLD